MQEDWPSPLSLYISTFFRFYNLKLKMGFDNKERPICELFMSEIGHEGRGAYVICLNLKKFAYK